MYDPNIVDAIYSEADTNRDGTISKKELRDWLSKNTRSSITNTGSFDENVVYTNSEEETNRYLATRGKDIYRHPKPRTIRKATTESPVIHRQRVLLRYLQPPPISLDPIIVKQIRPEQPPPSPPLIIREQQAHRLVEQPPLILRERPPTPPRYSSQKTEVEYLPPTPVPPRSLVIERFPPPEQKPRDIIIERWLPYEHKNERPKIIQPAPDPIQYPEPTHTIVTFDHAPTQIIKEFQNLGITQADPAAYMDLYGTSLLDSKTLIKKARDAGVVEDIPWQPLPSPILRDYSVDHRSTGFVENVAQRDHHDLLWQTKHRSPDSDMMVEPPLMLEHAKNYTIYSDTTKDKPDYHLNHMAYV